MIYYTKNIDNSGKKIVTNELQSIIDNAEINSKIIITDGVYLTGPIFLKSNIEVEISKHAMLLGITNEELIPQIYTRVAGIEMNWYPAVLNIIDAHNVKVHGEGVINGNGQYWWNKYWGEDCISGMRAHYDQEGLRWACDYDCKRPRNILISNSSNVILKDVTSLDSGFWNVHILYSHDILVDGVIIDSDSHISPSTDGIDIDSSYNIEVKNCITNCNDDSICIKSGRDSDGLIINKPSYNISIHDCIINKGFGITLGSELSGGIYDINIYNIKYNNTDCGFRIKSSYPRKGYIKNVFIDNLNMMNVKYCFHIYLNWNPLYSICELPENYNKEIPLHYQKLLNKVSDDIPKTTIEDIKISNVFADYDEDGIRRAFNIEGYCDLFINNISFNNVKIHCKEIGILKYINEFSLNNVKLIIEDSHNVNNDSYDNR